MSANLSLKHLIISIVLHFILFFMVVLSINFSSPVPVIENTNKNDVISAVILGDTPQSKIFPQKTKPVLQKNINKTALKKIINNKEIIAIKPTEKKLPNIVKPILKKPPPRLADDLLADIKKLDQMKKHQQLKSRFEKEMQDEAEKSLRQQLLDEKIKLVSKEAREAHGEINKYKALILQAISEHWIVPPGVDKKLYSELMIHLAPDGQVLDVQITKTSGNRALDNSVRAAVLKASPLPVPSNPIAFAAFKNFILKVKPENILA